jgi:nucleoside 2-deoxyribosyltransferase
MMTFYTAGKVWHNEKFQALRAKGFPVKARWIDLDNDSDFVLNKKDQLWKLCYEDVRDSDFVLLYCEDMNEEQRGALVEIGMAFGFDKPVYAVGACKTIKPNEISDVAFTHYERFHWLPVNDLTRGAMMAMEIERKKAQMIEELNLEVA